MSNQLLKTSGTEIVTADGQPFLIKGIGLGGWLVTEGYMLGIPGNDWASQFLPQQNSDPVAGSPSHLRQQLINLVGEEATDTFLQKFRNSYITKQDIKQIKDWGFNTIRLPLHYQDLSPQRGQYDEAGFALIDRVLKWAQKYGLYVILDMHAAPGGQNYADHGDSTKGGPQLWNNLEDQDWLAEIWGEIARRYRDKTQIAGYELLNEPDLEDNSPILRGVYEQIAQAIRIQDQNHILFIQGDYINDESFYKMDFELLKEPQDSNPLFDDNMVYSFHHYQKPNEGAEGIAAQIEKIRNFQGQELNVPILLGEFGENSNSWFSDAIQEAEDNNIGWTWWTYKKVDTITSPLSVDSPQQWDKVINYWKGKEPKPSAEEAQVGLDELVKSSKYDPKLIHSDVVASLTDPEFGTENKPFKNHQLPGKIDFIDYDLGENGIAYFDQLAEKVSKSDKDGNLGYSYRNDGVDIYPELYVGDTEAGEWLKYSVNIAQSGQYELFFTVASQDTDGGQIRLKVNNNYITDVINIPNTGGWLNWQTISTKNVSLSQGQRTLTVEVINGGVNLQEFHIDKKFWDDVLNGNSGNNTLDGGAGNDRLNGKNGDDVLIGGMGNDVLIGGKGQDSLNGGAGNDNLNGGLGKDKLTGGAGKDSFQFDSKTDGVDVITDFASAPDTIRLKASGFGSGLTKGVLAQTQLVLGSAAEDKGDRIIYDSSTGALFFDQDGKGGSPQIQFATLQNKLTIVSAADFVLF